MSEQAVKILNDFLAAESASLVSRLRECDAYVAWTAAQDGLVIDRITADSAAHRHELVETILKLRGQPRPAQFKTMPRSEHYLRLDFLMPQMVKSMKSLAATYASAGPTGNVEADALVARILADHMRHLAELERLQGKLYQPS